MSEHEHHGQPDHSHAPETRDAGSQALSEALRSSFVIVKFAMAALVVIIVLSGVFTVGPQEKAIILRFGKPVGEGQKMLLGAGAHWAFPPPIDEVIKIPITEIQKVISSVGWYRMTHQEEVDFETLGTEPPAGPTLSAGSGDGYVFTADRNIIHARAIVSYRIDDPLTAIFHFTSGTNQQFNLAGISNAVQNAANNALVATAARYNVDDILTGKFAEFQEAVGQRIRELVEHEQLGVAIELCEVHSEAPRQLKDVFAQVTTARINRDKTISGASSDTNHILSQADAQAVSITNAAETARNNFVKSVQSDAEVFNKLLPQYESNPRLYAQLELTKALTGVLTNVQRKEFLPERADGKTRELRLMLNDEPPQSRSAGSP